MARKSLRDRVAPKRWHRIRFYEGRWSNFDAIEPCKAPGACPLCDTKHAFCTEHGAVIPTESADTD
jgi:hypothetical protein